ncbi:MAG: squalene/phytoene synthase family protein [Alphaproteobacteria bacterium]|nr:squalene/phytoene synthase family protein [Alphaproteobacteria bacterium]
MTSEMPDTASTDIDASRLFGADLPVEEIVERSGSTFLAAIKLSKGERREAMYALYAFARILDDIADEPAAIDQRRAALAFWREEVAGLPAEAPRTPTTRALSLAVERFAIPKDELTGLIDGVAMDVAGPIVAPSEDGLALYCRRVAGCVGIAAIHIYGDTSEAARKFALSLADALQLTNILRDMKEDAAAGRLYLPRELLTEAGIEITDAQTILADPELPKVTAAIAAGARERFRAADAAYRQADRKALKPARLMMEAYGALFQALVEAGFPTDRRVSLPLGAKLKLLAKATLAKATLAKATLARV